MTQQFHPISYEGEPTGSPARYCENCGRPFEITLALQAPHKRFCSARCRYQHHYKTSKAKASANAEALLKPIKDHYNDPSITQAPNRQKENQIANRDRSDY